MPKTQRPARKKSRTSVRDLTPMKAPKGGGASKVSVADINGDGQLDFRRPK